MHLGRPIAQGNTACIYLRDRKIVKVFREGFSEERVSLEAQKQRFAHSCGLPVPEILKLTRIDGKPAIVMEHIEGSTIGDLMRMNVERAEFYLSLSIDMQRAVHAMRAGALEPLNDRLRRQILSAPALDEVSRMSLLAQLGALPRDDKLCHGDFHVFNLIQSDEKVVIIDWADASAGSVCADACRSYLLYLETSAELADMYLRLYCGKSGLVKEEVLIWMPVVAGARLSENVSPERTKRLMQIARI